MLYNEITYLFGLPIFKVKINPELYEKKKILSQIEKNYKTSKVRNKWSLDSYILTDIHHSIQDDDNPAFKKINYYLTEKIYRIYLLIKKKTVGYIRNGQPRFKKMM